MPRGKLAARVPAVHRGIQSSASEHLSGDRYPPDIRQHKARSPMRDRMWLKTVENFVSERVPATQPGLGYFGGAEDPL